MPLTLTTDNNNSSRVPGRWDSYHTLGGFPHKGYAGLATMMIEVDLAATAYEVGGVPLNKEVTGLQRVVNMWVLSGLDPFGAVVEPPQGLAFSLDATDPMNPLLVVKGAGGELGAGATQAAGTKVWLLLGGTD